MAHITVQLGPCRTVPFRCGVPFGPMAVWQLLPVDVGPDCGSGFHAPPRPARKRRRSRARLTSSLQLEAEIRP